MSKKQQKIKELKSNKIKQYIVWGTIAAAGLAFVIYFSGNSLEQDNKKENEVEENAQSIEKKDQDNSSASKEDNKDKKNSENSQDIILEAEKTYSIQSRDHIKNGESHIDYTTNPPLSGAHANAARGGFYGKGLKDENAIHNLEHGYTWISYKNISDEDIQKIKEITKKFSGSSIASLRNDNDFDGIALASWGNLMKLKKFDGVIVEDFIKRNKNKSPEKLAR